MPYYESMNGIVVNIPNGIDKRLLAKLKKDVDAL